jgi:Fe-S cluster biogenesis protein NfuA
MDDFRQQMQRLEATLHEIEKIPDPGVQARIRDIVQTLLELHGAGLGRLLAKLEQAGPAGKAILAELAGDEATASLLLLHGLHPTDVEDRVRAAIDSVRPRLASHGGGAELVGIADGVVRLRLHGGHPGSSASETALRAILEEAICDRAPEIARVDLDMTAPSTFIPVEQLRLRQDQPDGDRAGPVQVGHPEHCELCGTELRAEHAHLIEPKTRRLLCSCDPCAILFSNQAAGRYRRVAGRFQFLADFAITDLQWEALGLPINLAFFLHSTAAQRVVAIYPSPGGATESLLPLEAWNELVEGNPILLELEPDIEGLLVNRVKNDREYYRIPIDECYKLVGIIRRHWQGFTGGTEVWDEIGKFLSRLKERCGVRGEPVHA